MGTVGKAIARVAFPKVANRLMPRAGQPTQASMINTTSQTQPQPQPAPTPASMIGSR